MAIVFSAFLIGLLFYFAYILVCKLKNRQITKVFESAFIAILGIAIIKDIENWLFKSSNYSLCLQLTLKSFIYFLFAALVCALSVHLFTKTKKIKNSFLALCLIISPIIPVFLVTSFTYKSWLSSKGSLPYSRKLDAENRDRSNTFIFVFDEWSYDRSYHGKKLLPIFKNLSRFKESSTSFHQAYNHGASTLENLPNIIFQNSYHYDVKNNRLFFEDEGTGKKMLVEEMENIFTRPHREKYFTVCVGFYHPYAAFLEKDIDFTSSISAHKIFGENFFGVTSYHILKSLLLYSFHFFPQSTKWVEEVCLNQYQVRRTSAIHKQTLAILEKVDVPTFALFHYSIPHDAFVFDRNGTKNVFQIYEWTIDNYMDNLAYLDKIIGETILTLQQLGKFEDSLIIMTSDHSWRFDPDLLENRVESDEIRHVPLFIKFPNQKKGCEINDNLNTTALFEFIRQHR